MYGKSGMIPVPGQASDAVHMPIRCSQFVVVSKEMSSNNGRMILILAHRVYLGPLYYLIQAMAVSFFFLPVKDVGSLILAGLKLVQIVLRRRKQKRWSDF